MPRLLSLLLLAGLVAVGTFAAAGQRPKTAGGAAVAAAAGEEKTIQKLEADLLKAEMTSDPAVIDRILADDWVNLTPAGEGTNKAGVLEHYRGRAGQAPAYVAETEAMKVVLLGDTAIAAYVKAYKTTETNNVVQQDATDVFQKQQGGWKLKFSRTSPHAEQ